MFWQQAALTRTMAAFSRGLDTLVGEKGVVLSGGQKQRIALARALLVEAPLMLLDDPISQVDMATGRRLIHTLQNLQGARALLIVSHRLSAIRRADRIVVLDRGRIVPSAAMNWSPRWLLRRHRPIAGRNGGPRCSMTWAILKKASWTNGGISACSAACCPFLSPYRAMLAASVGLVLLITVLDLTSALSDQNRHRPLYRAPGDLLRPCANQSRCRRCRFPGPRSLACAVR
jgi:hypothetical protein